MFDTRWTPDLTAAVKRFQVRHGLKDTGVVAGATLKALNVSARDRFTELASSAQRLAGRNFTFADRYVVVNLPSASVEAVENGQVAHRYVAIVGDAEHASPEVDAKVVAVNLNPTWTVPTSIIKNEIIPKMQKDPGYLSRETDPHPRRCRQSVNPARSTGPASAPSTTRCGRIPAKPIRWDRSASTCRTSSRSICMTRRPSVCSAATIASCRMAACGFRASTTSRRGCCRHSLGAPDGTVEPGCHRGQVADGAARGSPARASRSGGLGLSDRLGQRRRRGEFPRRRLWHRHGRRQRAEAQADPIASTITKN